MNTALIAGDKATALNYLSVPAQAKYGPVFDELMPSYGQIADSFSDPPRGTLSPDIGEYVINRTLNGSNQVFLIYFARGADGVWRLDSM